MLGSNYRFDWSEKIRFSPTASYLAGMLTSFHPPAFRPAARKFLTARNGCTK
jgi:hypothetical protein